MTRLQRIFLMLMTSRGLKAQSSVTLESMPLIAFLECSRCQKQISADKYGTVCPACAGALYVRYDMDALKKTAARPEAGGLQSMWRYSSILPQVNPVTLGEGWTPMLPSRRNPN